MKCIKSTQQGHENGILNGMGRVCDNKAFRMVRSGDWEYCSKSEYKRSYRIWVKVKQMYQTPTGWVRRTDSMALYGVLRGKGDI